MILRSDKSYAKKKGFNIMFTVNGDGSGDAGNEKVPFTKMTSSEVALRGMEKAMNYISQINISALQIKHDFFT